MRILLLSDWMSSRGGAETYILSLRDELRRLGDEVVLISCGAGKDEGAGDVHAYGTDRFVAQSILQLVNPFATRCVRETVRTFRPEAALVSQFAYHLSPAVLGALSPVPAAVSMMDYKAICPTGTRLLPGGALCNVRAGAVCRSNRCVGTLHWLRDQPRYRMIHNGLRGAKRVLCSTSWMNAQLEAAGIEAVTVPLGIAAVDPVASRKPARQPTFVYCGRLSREKGVALLIAAFAKVKATSSTARLKIVGDGPLRRELEKLAALLGVSGDVQFTGWVAREEIDAELGDAWALVAPSLWAEPFGLSAVEAMVRGIPVIASETGGFSDTVEHGVSGLLFPNGDVASLAERMGAVASRAAFPDHRLPRDAVERAAAKFGIQGNARQVREILAEIAAREAA